MKAVCPLSHLFTTK